MCLCFIQWAIGHVQHMTSYGLLLIGFAAGFILACTIFSVQLYEIEARLDKLIINHPEIK